MKFRIQNPEALSAIPIDIIAGIGAKFQTADSDPAESIRLAYTLLDAAAAAQESLKTEGDVDPGLFDFRFERAKAKAMPRVLAERKADPLYKEKDGKPLAVPFDEAVSIIFGRAIKKSEREKRLFLYLTEKEETPTFLEPFIQGTPFSHLFPKSPAKETFDSWKRDGIPFGEYTSLKQFIPEWWKTRLSRIQSAKRAGKTKEAPKGKQGRVVRKNDKRKGSRAGSFLKALKKIS